MNWFIAKRLFSSIFSSNIADKGELMSNELGNGLIVDILATSFRYKSSHKCLNLNFDGFLSTY